MQQSTSYTYIDFNRRSDLSETHWKLALNYYDKKQKYKNIAFWYYIAPLKQSTVYDLQTRYKAESEPYENGLHYYHLHRNPGERGKNNSANQICSKDIYIYTLMYINI